MNLSRSLLIGLIVSAALNVFLIGGVAGVVWVRQASSASPAATLTPRQAAALEEFWSTPQKPEPSQAAAPPPRSPPAATSASGDAAPRPPLWSAGQNLSPEARQTLRRALHEANKRNQPITREARGERQAALQAMKAKPYDPTEVSKRLAAARALDIQARGNVEAALANYAVTLSPEERAVLADGLARVYAPRLRPARTEER